MVCRPGWTPLVGRRKVPASIRKGDDWARMVMADLEEGEIEDGELPVTEPEVRQLTSIVSACAAMMPYVLSSSWLHVPLVCRPALILTFLRLPAGFAGAPIYSSKPVSRA